MAVPDAICHEEASKAHSQSGCEETAQEERERKLRGPTEQISEYAVHHEHSRVCEQRERQQAHDASAVGEMWREETHANTTRDRGERKQHAVLEEVGGGRFFDKILVPDEVVFVTEGTQGTGGNSAREEKGEEAGESNDVSGNLHRTRDCSAIFIRLQRRRMSAIRAC